MTAAHRPTPRTAAARVRRFNRFYTRRIGLLDAHLHAPFSLAEARVLYEVAHRRRPTAAAIASALDLDPGYLSRILRGLQHRGLLTARVVPHDRRQRVLALTARGRRAFATLDTRATAEVLAMLEGLSPPERDRLLVSLETVGTLLGETAPVRSPAPVIALRAPVSGDLGWVVERHGELYLEEYGWNADCERLIARIVGEFAAAEPGPLNRGWIATVDGRRAGCVFLMRGGEGVGQLRLLLVEPWARGYGLGGRLVDTCIQAARSAGCHTLTLWTNDVLTAARRLYERAGFQLVKSERHRSFGKTLTGQTWNLTLAGPSAAPAARQAAGAGSP